MILAHNQIFAEYFSQGSDGQAKTNLHQFTYLQSHFYVKYKR